jgi:hypothetical protein
MRDYRFDLRLPVANPLVLQQLRCFQQKRWSSSAAASGQTERDETG